MKLLFLTMLYFFNLLKGDPTSLEIEIRGIRNNKGSIKIGLYNYENQFPYQPYQSYIANKLALKEGAVVFDIENLEPGTYAISLLDDENMNNEMDYSWLGIPQEGYGFSNNAKPKLLGPPAYNDCVFTVIEKTKTKIKIDIKYF